MFVSSRAPLWCSCVMAAFAAAAPAQPSLVEHSPAAQTFGEPAGITQREPDVPREDEPVQLYLRVSFQFTYDRVCLYYTTDGSEPAGSFGTPSGSTQVLRNDLGSVVFVRNESSGGARDWWRAELPSSARQYAQTIRYKISAWQQFSGGEVFANSGSSYSYVNKLAWPGAGAGQPNPAAGYPPVSFWKEEAIFGNGYCAGMLDQNGTVYDFHFPTPGGIQGVGTRNEGYVDGLDTFPPGLPVAWRGQMHLNQAMAGLRVDDVTHWFSNPSGVSYTDVQQSYVPDTNTIQTTSRLFSGGNNIEITQVDFAPAGITFPSDQAGNPQRHLYIKTITFTNRGPTKPANFYWYLDPALNGGDGYDGMYFDPAHGAMVAFDNTYRVVTGTGTGFTPPNEYNPTTSAGYEKNLSLYLAAAIQPPVGSTPIDRWSDTSTDQDKGWIGCRLTLPTNTPVTVRVLTAGAHDSFAGATGTYSFKLANVVSWFYSTPSLAADAQTNAYWQNWLAAGTTVDTPDDSVDEVYRRGLLATALHCDAVNGGVIAGFHNGAYPYVWPRDAVYAAVTLARTGHLAEAGRVYAWMKDTCFRDFEPWGRRGFWKQKYSTDGYVIWGAPQIDETAVFPWGVWHQYLLTADASLLNNYVEQVRDSVQSMTRDSSDSHLRYEEAFNLVYSNNVWEDSYDTFIYSNANVVRGLRDAANILATLALPAEAADAATRAGTIKSGLDARLDWNGENTDISQLGASYPFEVYAPADPRMTLVADRINGVATDRFGNNHPLVNFGGEHQDTVNRYWGDNYWNGGPWFLSTLWYGLYYAQRQDQFPGTADIDNHRLRVGLCIDRLGPAGMGAEQIAYGAGPAASLLYPGQQDFKLQTAWPNAWESMSTFVDSVMIFLDYTPDAPASTMRFEPKLPGAWNSMTFRNVTLAHAPTGRTHKVDVAIARTDNPSFDGGESHVFTNQSGHALNVATVLRADTSRCIAGVSRNGVPIAFTFDALSGRVSVGPFPLQTGAGATTTIAMTYFQTADYNQDGGADNSDVTDLANDIAAGTESFPPNVTDFNADGGGDNTDVTDLANVIAGGSCP